MLWSNGSGGVPLRLSRFGVENNTNICLSLGTCRRRKELKVYKTGINFQRVMTCLLNDGSKYKNVVNSMVCQCKSNLPPSFKMSLFKLLRKVHVKDCSIEF